MNQTIYRLAVLISCTGLPLQVATAASAKASRPVNSKAQSQAMVAVSSRTPAPAAAKTMAPQSAPRSPIGLTVGRDVSRATLATAVMRQPVTASAHIPLSVPQVQLTCLSPLPAKEPLAAKTAPNASVPVTIRSGALALGAAAATGLAYAGERLARVTAYWAAEGDYYTGRGMSATGVRLHDGHCAVDPTIIPYGSVVNIPGVGKFLAVDTGSAVISRTAAREGGHTYDERHALVVDIFFEDRDAGQRFASAASKFTAISWWTPSSTDILAKAARSLFADEDWLKIQSKQL